MTENSWPALNLDPNSVPDLVGWLARRDTVRQFDPGAEIPDEDVRELVDAGRKAPTSGTLQMYSFLWVRDAGVKERIHALCDWGTPQIEESSHFLLVCIDLRRVRLLHEYRGLPFESSPVMAVLEGGIDAALAAGAVMIAAESRGYGVCPVGNILTNVDLVVKTVDLPTGVLPVFGLALGVPHDGSSARSTPRIPLETVLHDEEYEDPSPELLAECYEVMNQRYPPDSNRTWEGTIKNYWTPDGFMNRHEETLRRALQQQGFFSDCEANEDQGMSRDWEVTEDRGDDEI